MTLTNSQIQLIKSQYTAITNHSSRGSVKDYNSNDWNNVVSIGFGKDSTFSDELLDILLGLDKLEEINLHEYSCNFDITIEELKKFQDKGINVIFNKTMNYSDKEVRRFINQYKVHRLEQEEKALLQKLEYIRAEISRLS